MSIVQYIKSERKFFFLVAGLYACSITSALNYERLLKQPFANKKTGQMEYLTYVFLVAFSTNLTTAIITKVILIVTKNQKTLPWKDCLACGIMNNLSSFGYNSAIMVTSFPAVVMVKSCSLLSVVLVGVLCSKVRSKELKLGGEKIPVGFMACLGIIIFNHWSSNNNQSSNQPIAIFSMGTFFLIISLIGDGFLPDFQAKIKSQNKPTAIQLCYSVNIYASLIGLLFLIARSQLISSLTWLFEHQGAFFSLLLISVLSTSIQLFVYQMIKEYRQHVPAFVMATRKCITVVLSLIWYHHTINFAQIIGIMLVFFSIFFEVYTNYLNSLKKLQQQKISAKQKQTLEGQSLRQEEENLDVNIDNFDNNKKVTVDIIDQNLPQKQ